MVQAAEHRYGHDTVAVTDPMAAARDAKQLQLRDKDVIGEGRLIDLNIQEIRIDWEIFRSKLISQQVDVDVEFFASYRVVG